MRSGADEHHFVVRQFIELIKSYRESTGHLEISQITGNIHRADHGSADERDLSSVSDRCVDDLLNTVDVRGETRNHQAPRGAGKDLIEYGRDVLFARDEAADFGIRGVHQEEVDTVIAEARE